MAKKSERPLPIRIGGVMRCCVATVREWTGEPNEGTTLPCNFCASQMRVRDGAWEWDSDYREDDAPPPPVAQ
jgi:hypothetical protein